MRRWKLWCIILPIDAFVKQKTKKKIKKNKNNKNNKNNEDVSFEQIAKN